MIRIGILGAARIAPGALIDPCADEARAEVHCIAARDRGRAEQFAVEHGIPVVHNDYNDVISDPVIDAVYNPLPISLHHEWTIRALRADKHVLCEKSLSANAREAAEMATVAEDTDRILMEAFHYRYHPVFHRAKEIVDSGMLGQLRSIDAVFHIEITDPEDIRMIYETGGGVTMDIGCYPISWVRHITGEEPIDVTAAAETGAANVDTFLQARFRFPAGIEATVSGDMRPGTEKRMELTVTGDQGTIKVTNPLVPHKGHRIELDVQGHRTAEELDHRTTYAYQLDAFIDAVENGTPLLTGPADAVKQMQLIDRCYEAAGLPLRGLDV
ncbi:MAG: Gfo/Idh/MocA family oxidoreductase [Fuerstiella sp.]|nr:Gfo/Idh/MocA family oxidoreductase [Fuerstiella sp.]